MSGAEIKQIIKASGVKLWQVADEFGVTDGNFSRKLRHDFNESDSQKVLSIIDRLKKWQKEKAYI